jgi:hypothetical protein
MKKVFVLFLSFGLFILNGYAQESDSNQTRQTAPDKKNGEGAKPGRISFPDMFKQDSVDKSKIADAATPAGADTKEDAEKKNKEHLHSGSIILNSDIVAYYGHPNSKNMGILGRLSKENLLARLNAQADEYRKLSNGRNVVEAFYIIYATVWPKGNVGIIGDKRLEEYIDFAADNNLLVFLDHQIGKYDPVESLRSMLPYLKYPNVHLALDPEWRTTKPMQEIGYVTGEEVNRAQQLMEDYIVRNNIPGERMLVIHQFNRTMIRRRNVIRADFERVRLIICMDGHGHPAKKRDSYELIKLAKNIPVKAFKLFYNEKGNVGVDIPLMTPKEVYALDPPPRLIMYH